VHSWHGFGLAADVIHRTKRWSAPAQWWHTMGSVFKAHGCTWGGDWKSFPDLPHVQWGAMPNSPDDEDRRLLANGGTVAVWRRWGAV
jgi:peptidoglycan L-alanyl-D-glutamate endopeptidase CwlK